jgi:NAD+ kinase
VKNKPIKRVLIILKPTLNNELKNIVKTLVNWLLRRKITISFFEKEHNRISKITNRAQSLEFIPKKMIHRNDLIITLGGDGTLIGVCRLLKKRIPILGINCGKLGFITEFDTKALFDILGEILKGIYQAKTIFTYSAKVFSKSSLKFESNFVNDVVINKTDIARLFSVYVECKNESLFKLSGDGVIISTTLGSTAYSLAAGGPIVHPDVKGLLVTPICPHSLAHRPFVLPDNLEISLKLEKSEKPVMLTIDGQVSCEVNPDDIIIITKNKRSNVEFISNSEKSYFLTLKTKLFTKL